MREKWNDSCAVKRDRKEEIKVERSRLMREDCLPLWAMVMSRPRMLPRVMSGSLVLQHPGSEWMSEYEMSSHRLKCLVS